jgi:hypothetical protein
MDFIKLSDPDFMLSAYARAIDYLLLCQFTFKELKNLIFELFGNKKPEHLVIWFLEDKESKYINRVFIKDTKRNLHYICGGAINNNLIKMGKPLGIDLKEYYEDCGNLLVFDDDKYTKLFI